MKLFKLSQEVNFGYDTYDSCVVCAKSKKDAVTIHPDGGEFNDEDLRFNKRGPWAHKIADIKCEEIGDAKANQTRGVIVASFNAG